MAIGGRRRHRPRRADPGRAGRAGPRRGRVPPLVRARAGTVLRGDHRGLPDRGRRSQLPRPAARRAVRAEQLPRLVTGTFVPLPALDELDATACADALAPLFEGAPRFLARLVAGRPFGDAATLFVRARAIAHAIPED